MNPQKNQGEETSPLFRDLQAEVSSESAPLLQFMLRHAGIIAGVVILFLLVLAGTGIWRWYSGRCPCLPGPAERGSPHRR